MNDAQMRVLAVAELEFYRLQVSPNEFNTLCGRQGYKLPLDVSTISTERLTKLNLSVRYFLRLPKGPLSSGGNL